MSAPAYSSDEVIALARVLAAAALDELIADIARGAESSVPKPYAPPRAALFDVDQQAAT
ncbi:MAG: hypothetical protein ACLQO1_01715 [Steroidobacteraceae bacterium]